MEDELGLDWIDEFVFGEKPKKIRQDETESEENTNEEKEYEQDEEY